MIKPLGKLGIEQNFLNLIKDIYKNSTLNVIINDIIWNIFPLSSETDKDVYFHFVLFIIVCEAFSLGRKRNKSHKDWDRRSRIIFIYDNMILHIENSKESTLQILLNLISKFSKGY